MNQINLEQLKNKVSELESAMQNPANVSDNQTMSRLGKEYNLARQTFDLASDLEKTKAEVAHLKESMSSERDDEMLALTMEEINMLESKIHDDSEKLQELVSPQDPADEKDIILEIRAGTGGDESSLFAADLFRMYSRFAEKNGFKLKILSVSKTEMGGFKEIIAEVHGEKVYKHFKFESGVHRVQRVPETEKAGRIHTSAATVAVMPEAEEIDLKIDPKDIRIDTFCASGHGGQSVNTTYSAVRVTHLPTGTIVSCQDEKQQGQNKEKALAILRSRLLAKAQEEKDAKEAANRKNQVGTGDRSEKIRTYNWPQDRVTDHRIKLTLHNINTVMDGDLMPLISALWKAQQGQ
ncbi:MAG: peptide chain release factor 1 [Parcubacteria group bacterium]|nr:MAG: peptide chain release factor 1 [Parcubacteria group bacterium]